MKRAILIALAGQIYFILSLPLMMPLRMKPIENYNLFFTPVLAIILAFLFYRMCTEQKESKSYLYAFFGAIVLWQLVGELASLPVPSGIITQFSDVNIKLLGGYFYVVTGWLILLLFWKTQSIKNSVAVCFMTFLGIWTFELYMDNYSLRVPVGMMPKIANIISLSAVVLSVVILYIAKKTASIEKKTVMGCLLYLTIAILLSSSGQWGKPSAFYIKYEAAGIGQEIEDLKAEQEHILKLKKYMIDKGWMKRE